MCASWISCMYVRDVKVAILHQCHRGRTPYLSQNSWAESPKSQMCSFEPILSLPQRSCSKIDFLTSCRGLNQSAY